MAGGPGVVKTYAAKEVTISCGSHLCTGVADDSFVSIEPGGDGITYKYGCDGEIARAVSPNGRERRAAQHYPCIFLPFRGQAGAAYDEAAGGPKEHRL